MTYSQEKPTGISGSGKVTLPAYSMLALTLVGIGVAVYVARGNYTGQPLWCPIIDGCNANSGHAAFKKSSRGRARDSSCGVTDQATRNSEQRET
jgi:hypothetical protein